MSLKFTNGPLPVHPRTGFTAIGTLKSGRPVWPVMGGDGTDDSGADSSTDSTKDKGSADTGGDSGDSSDDKSGKGSDGAEGDGDSTRTYSATEYDKLVARMKAADRRADAVANKLKEIEDKDKPAEQKLKDEHKELTASLKRTQEQTKQLRIQVAFLQSNEVQWHDPEDALTMANLSGVEIDEDGNVDGKALRAALKDLAKRKPHLVKTAKKSDDTDDDSSSKEDDSDKDVSNSGTDMAGKRKGGSPKTPSRAELAKKFPALRKR